MSTTAANYIFYQTSRKPPMVDRAAGIRIWDIAGKEYIDASPGAVVCDIGYGNPQVLQAVPNSPRGPLLPSPSAGRAPGPWCHRMNTLQSFKRHVVDMESC